jgi:hypothetical protein
MKTCLLILVANLFFSSQVLAREIEVRSGEHDTFTRIVMNIPVGTKWDLTQTGNLAKLTINLPDIQYDTSQVFNRIPRSRLTGVSQRKPGESLQLNFGCECKVAGFTQSGTLLVIDIQDPEHPANKGHSIFDAAPTLRFSNVVSIDTHNPNLSWNLKPETPSVIAEPAPFENLVGASVIGISAQNSLENVNTSELRLLSQIDRATAQGLLLRNMQISENYSTTMADVGGDKPRRHNTDTKPSPQVSMTAITSMDRDLVEMNGQDLQIKSQISCLSAEHVALPEWGNELPFGTQIGNRRSKLFGEFDSVNQQAVTDLVRNLLFFGFGAEAKKALGLSTVENLTHEVLNALAEILDNGQVLAHNPFKNQKGCDSDVALWAYLAGPDFSTNEKPNSSAVLRAFTRLPDHLRVLLGPTLIKKFSDSQDVKSAEIASRAANRTLKNSDPGLDLAQANADIQYKDPEIAVGQMARIAQSGTKYSPQALIDLVNAQTLADQTISPDIPDLVATYKLEFRKSDLAADLHRAHVLSLALAQRFPEAFANYHDDESNYSNPDKYQTLAQALTLLTNRASDLTFLRYSLLQIEKAEPKLPIEVQNLLAARLIDLGFSERASQLLTEQNGRGTVDRRLMNAQIAISKNLPHRALVELLGSDNPLAESIRTQAFLNIGDYENAGLSQEAHGTDPGRSFWHAENWSAVIRQEDSQFSEAANLAKSLRAASINTDDNHSLAHAQALADRSLETRTDISDLLRLVGQKP